MQLSTDLTYGLRAVQQHIASGAKLPMNVSAEADAAFMRELQREDSQGYDRLMKNIQTAAIRSVEASSTVAIRPRRCERRPKDSK